MEIEERVVLVTGGNRGLGAAFVKALLRFGVKKVYVGSRNLITVEDERVVPVKLDITSLDDVNEIGKELTDLNMIINNAGIHKKTEFGSMEALGTVNQVFATNVLGTLAITQAVSPTLIENKDSIVVNILSVGSWMNVGTSLAYGISKAGELSLTNNMRAALNPKGIQVAAVHAGFIDTDMMKDFKGKKLFPEDVAEQTLKAVFEDEQEILIDEMAKKAKSFASEPIPKFSKEEK